jgi:hypothetical protein
MSKNVRDQVARTLRDLRFSPKGRVRPYQKPYPDYFDSVPYPREFRVPDFVKFTGEDSRSTYEHIGQYLAQISDVSANDVYKVSFFLLSLSGTAFNWFTALASNSISTWASLEEKFHEYFYNGETKLKLSDLIAVRQKYTETVTEYIKRFRENRNKCYSLTVREWDLADLALAGLSSYLREKLEGHEFSNVNQVLQHVVAHENCSRDARTHGRYRESGREKEKSSVGALDENVSNDEDTEMRVTEWVDMPKGKPVTCPFLKPSPESERRWSVHSMWLNVISCSIYCCRTTLLD